ncbi:MULTISPECIES: hypothetical protein [Mycolicibacterium]|uniref:Uncharacterized protein n=3 Tax=Mycolicibacterium TaxID=1866885 RepID=A0AAE4VIR7_MYCFO|nr:MULTISPECIES: hypothetical protein [Mycolicibacterium]KLI04508.1 hypothetical protein AA982_29400 [Mycolicibacterium senegalense]KLO53848.1 hypothetical protein ABW05_22530 [Mycolicibacterium senegalense]KMV16340.1 hypothetical protein ACT17_20435 [Mycolicibacterium conceptionense]MDV7194289.1 hypothetical protein [Mycolicibacterium fortuitum]MDV7294292.1 hypothetical protein [Mycolicibacterium fortuitum]
MEHRVPLPNPWRRDWLRGPECRALVTERIHTAQMMYQAAVAKRSSALARSAHTTVALTGSNVKYWAGTLSVGETGMAATYVLAHEFGADERYDENRGDPSFDETEGARDLNDILETIAWVPM